MKLRKEAFFIPAFIIIIYLFEKSYINFFNDRSLHFIVEFISLFIVGLFIGVDKTVLNNHDKNKKIDIIRMIFTVVPILVLMFFTFGIYFIFIPVIMEKIKLPSIIISLTSISMYNQVGLVLLGYFITSSIKLQK